MIWIYLLGVCGITVVLVMSRVAKPLRHALPPPIGFRGIELQDPMEIAERLSKGEEVPAIEPSKRRAVMLGCTLCTGVWIGMAVGLLAFFAEFLPQHLTRIANAFLFGFAAAFISYAGGTWLRNNDGKH